MQIEGGPRSHHGGDNDADNSGTLSYVRELSLQVSHLKKTKKLMGLLLDQ